MDYKDFFAEKLEALRAEGNYREFIEISRQAGQFPLATQMKAPSSKSVVVWCSNDYLGMGQMRAVCEAMMKGIDRTDTCLDADAEANHLAADLAEHHQKEDAVLFTSGYLSNYEVLKTLGRQLPDCVILSDERNHASMIEGIRASGAKKRIWRHNDVADLESHLSRLAPNQAKIIAFESVYSMDGDVAPIPEICDVAERFGALTYVDEVHAVGMYGNHGAGIAEQLNCMDRLDIIEGTLAKAYGIVGGYVTASRTICEFIRQHVPDNTEVFSLPTGASAAARVSLRHLRWSTYERKRQRQAVRDLRQKLDAAGIPHIENPSHIVPVIVGDPVKCKALTDALLFDYGIYVQPINYPTVPRGTERLRINPGPLHTKDQATELVNALSTLWRQLGLSCQAA
ncbi:MAG: 5-aminolevulinate synthase [Pseudomonadota bacterium]